MRPVVNVTVANIPWVAYEIERGRIAWCADGDGLLAVEFHPGRGFFLRGEWSPKHARRRPVAADLKTALRIASQYLKRCMPECFNYLATDRFFF